MATKLRRFEQQVTIAASASGTTLTTGTVTLPNNRGKLVSIDIEILNGTIGTVDGMTVTTKLNGDEMHSNASLTQYSYVTAKQKETAVPVLEDIPDGSTFDYSFANDANNTVLASLVFNYRPDDKKRC